MHGVCSMARDVDEITGIIIESSIRIHQFLGPGLLESVYKDVLPRDLRRRGLRVEQERIVPFEFEGMRFNQGLKVDVLVEDEVVVELKSVERLAPVHFKQTLTYLRLLDKRVGLLITFGQATLKEGLHRIVNRYVRSAASPLNKSHAEIAEEEHKTES